jgi:tetratricopeptide (TPR) repeat protein
MVQRLVDARLLVQDWRSGVDVVEVAHESLLRTWPALKGWLDEEREFLLWRDEIEVRRKQYERAGKNRDLLLRGLPLKQAKQWVKAKRSDIGSFEQDFIEISNIYSYIRFVAWSGLLIGVLVLGFSAAQEDARRSEAGTVNTYISNMQAELDRILPNDMMEKASDSFIQYYDRAIARDDSNAVLRYGRGSVFYYRKSYDKAIADYGEAIRLNPSYKEAFFYRGRAYFNRNEYDAAIAHYTQSIQLDPKYKDAFFYRGLAYYEAKEYEMAVADYAKAIELNPDDAMSYNRRGLAYEASGATTLAIADFRKSLSLDPAQQESEGALKRLGADP